VAILAGAAALYSALADRAVVDTPLLLIDGHERPGMPAGPPPEQAGVEDIEEGIPEHMPDEQHEEEDNRVSAPDFVVQDIDQNYVRLSDFHGSPIVLSFWTSWCGACSAQMPYFNAVFMEMGDDVHFMMVNLVDGARETRESGKAYIAQQGYTFPIFFDMDGEASIAYGVRAIPATYFINAEGFVLAHAGGMIDAETLRHGISLITT